MNLQSQKNQIITHCDRLLLIFYHNANNFASVNIWSCENLFASGNLCPARGDTGLDEIPKDKPAKEPRAKTAKAPWDKPAKEPQDKPALCRGQLRRNRHISFVKIKFVRQKERKKAKRADFANLNLQISLFCYYYKCFLIFASRYSSEAISRFAISTDARLAFGYSLRYE